MSVEGDGAVLGFSEWEFVNVDVKTVPQGLIGKLYGG